MSSSPTLLDRCIQEIDKERSGPDDPDWRELLRSSIVKIRADNVAEYVRENWDEKDYDYPCIAPPWPKMWIEFESVPKDGKPATFGLWCTSIGNSVDGWTTTVHVYVRAINEPSRYLTSAKLSIDGRGKFIKTAFIGEKNVRESTDPDFDVVAAIVQPKRNILNTPRFTGEKELLTSDELHAAGPFKATALRSEAADARKGLLDLERKIMACTKDINHAYRAAGWKMFGSFTKIAIHILGMTLSFCHCKNVEKDAEFASSSRMPKPKRKEFPSYRYSVLRVTPFGKKSSHDSSSFSEASGRAMHIRRGHFKTWTAERPLFGRIVGTFWCPQTLVGDESLGVVEKSYEVDAAG